LKGGKAFKKKAKGIPEGKCFIVCDGRQLKSIKELAESLDDMSDDAFRHHVSEMRNDFSNWVKDIFQEEDLSEELKQLNTKMDTQLTILKHLVKKLD